eukprot:COSAG02_NODE_2611_length_8430_cov_2.839755_4_plen_132_part_00
MKPTVYYPEFANLYVQMRAKIGWKSCTQTVGRCFHAASIGSCRWVPTPRWLALRLRTHPLHEGFARQAKEPKLGSWRRAQRDGDRFRTLQSRNFQYCSQYKCILVLSEGCKSFPEYRGVRTTGGPCSKGMP